MGYVALVLVVGHLVALGWKGWVNVSGWTGGMPPISLVALVAALVPLVVKRRLVLNRRAREARSATARP